MYRLRMIDILLKYNINPGEDSDTIQE